RIAPGPTEPPRSRTDRSSTAPGGDYDFTHRGMGFAPPARIAMTVAFISNSDCGRHDTGWGHPEHVGRLRAIPKALREEPELYARLLHHESRHATPDELALAHEPRYVEVVREVAIAGGGRLDADTVVSEGSWEAATAGAGA